MTAVEPAACLDQRLSGSPVHRLERPALWRAAKDAQRINVTVTIGQASLTISDRNGRPLNHWSLAAIERLNPGKHPAIYFPHGDVGQALEFDPEAQDLIDELETISSAFEKQRAHPGRLRLVTFLTTIALLGTALWLWLPGALRDHAVAVVPDVKRLQIGLALRSELERVTGPACDTTGAKTALQRLAARLPAKGGPGQLDVMRNGVRHAVSLPGGTILLGRSLAEDFEAPDVLAGFVVAEQARAQVHDPLSDLLDYAGPWASAQLLTTGRVPGTMLAEYAEHLLTAPRPHISDEALLNGFRAWSVRSTPYAYARDITGETTLGLIEADPFAVKAPPALISDADWLQLQTICSG